MQMDLIVDTWRLGLGEVLMMAESNKDDKMQGILQLNRFLHKAYADHEIPLIIRRHSPILGCSILEYILSRKNSGALIMKMLSKEV